jgi:hypothetical protein
MKKPSVVLYGIGDYLALHYGQFAEKYDVIALCDANPQRPRAYPLNDVRPINEILGGHPDCNFVISADPNGKKREIQEYLVGERGMDKKRILNFEPYRLGYGCVFHNSQVSFDKMLHHCCGAISHDGKFVKPTVCKFSDTPEETADNFVQAWLARKNEFKKIYAAGDKLEGSDTECAQCLNLKFQWLHDDEKPHLNSVFFESGANSNRCNYRCVYCNEIRLPKSNVSVPMQLEVFDEFRKRNIVEERFRVAVCGLEPALNPYIGRFASIPPP